VTLAVVGPIDVDSQQHAVAHRDRNVAIDQDPRLRRSLARGLRAGGSGAAGRLVAA
jgi:hypothetical protein